MKPKTLIFLGVAIVCGLGAAILTAALIARPTNQNTELVWQVNEAKYPKGLPRGQVLTHAVELDMFVQKPVPKDQVPTDAIKDLKVELAKHHLKKELLPRTALTKYYVRQGVGIQGSLPDGFQAMSMPTNVVKDGGFIFPNSKVDIVCTISDGTRVQSETVFKDVLVLAVNQLDDEPEAGNAVAMNSVLLAIPPKWVGNLATAIDKGSLKLTLRRSDRMIPEAEVKGLDYYDVQRDAKGDPVLDKDGKEIKMSPWYNQKGFEKLFPAPKTDGDKVAGPGGPGSVDILVAKKDIPAGQVIDKQDEWFKAMPFLASSLPPDYLVPGESLAGRRIYREVRANQYISKADLDKRDLTSPSVGPGPREVAHRQVWVNGQNITIVEYDKDWKLVGTRTTTKEEMNKSKEGDKKEGIGTR